MHWSNQEGFLGTLLNGVIAAPNIFHFASKMIRSGGSPEVEITQELGTEVRLKATSSIAIGNLASLRPLNLQNTPS